MNKMKKIEKMRKRKRQSELARERKNGVGRKQNRLSHAVSNMREET